MDAGFYAASLVFGNCIINAPGFSTGVAAPVLFGWGRIQVYNQSTFSTEGFNMDIVAGILIGIIVLYGAWFVVGALNNNRRAEKIFAWLRSGLAAYGKLGAVKRLDPSAISIGLVDEQADNPFPRFEAVLELERRENMPLWIYYEFKGMRDRMQIKTNLLNAPHSEVHALLPEDKPALDSLSQDKDHPLVLRSTHGGLQVFTRDSVDKALMSALEELLDACPGCFTRLSLQAKQPQLTAAVVLPKAMQTNPEAFFQRLAKL
jgi:hypothetical protein